MLAVRCGFSGVDGGSEACAEGGGEGGAGEVDV